MNQHTHILIFSIGPVQSFIAEARRTVDLYAGSQMLAKIACAAAQAVLDSKGELISPTQDSLQCGDADRTDTPNVIIALVNDPEQVARQAEEQATKRWQDFADAAWKKLEEQDDPALQKIWHRQRDNHLEFYWVATPYEPDYKKRYELARQSLAARKWTRDFGQPEPEDGPKDALSGSRSALRTSKSQNKAQAARDYWSQMRDKTTAAELQEGELLDTIGAMKRFIETGQQFPSTSTIAITSFIKQAAAQHGILVNELVDNIKAINQSLKNLPPDVKFDNEDTLQTVRRIAHENQNYFRCIENFADSAFPYGGDLLFIEGWARGRLADNYGPLPDTWYKQIEKQLEAARGTLRTLHQELIAPSPYYAILQMDGDEMGKHISQCQKLANHQQLSARLAEFTNAASDIVQENHGYLVYAGGDDVLAFFPVETALAAAGALAKAYRGKFEDWPQKDEDGNNLPFTASAGIAFAHYIQPLDLVLEAARAAEKRTKNEYGRNAVCVTVLRRSGEQLDVGGKWAGEPERENAPAPNTVEMVTELIKRLQADEIASRFSYNVLRDAPTITAIDSQGRNLILQQLARQHKAKSLQENIVRELVKKWLLWANQHDVWVPPDPDFRPKNKAPKNQGFVELARWFVLARWLAEGGQE